MTTSHVDVKPAVLPEDGERFLPLFRGAIRYEHLHRYALCAPYVIGREVLDVASGEGYGSALLAKYAARVTGIDNSVDAVAHASRIYVEGNLRFEVGDVRALPLESGSVDVVISFETIEHVDDHTAMLNELCRILRPGGTLIVSSPNKAVYSDAVNHKNAFHVNELYVDAFVALLKPRFANVHLFGQRLVGVSLVARIENTPSGMVNTFHGTPSHVGAGLTTPLPMYVIAVCSDSEVDTATTESLFVDDEQDLLVELQSYFNRSTELMVRARRRADLRVLSTSTEVRALSAFVDTTDGVGVLDVLEEGRSGLRYSDGVTVGSTATIMLAGWALFAQGAPDRVVITVDDVIVASAIPTARPDVAAVHGEHAAFAGFAGLVPIAQVPGKHFLSIHALDYSSSRRSCIATTEINVIDRQHLEQTATMHLDVAERQGAALEPGTLIGSSDLVRLRGWGFDPLTQLPFDVVALLIDDDFVVPAVYASDRRDVADAFGLSDANVGIEVELLGDAFGDGIHEIRLLGIRAGGAGSELISSSQLTITVSGPASAPDTGLSSIDGASSRSHLVPDDAAKKN